MPACRIAANDQVGMTIQVLFQHVVSSFSSLIDSVLYKYKSLWLFLNVCYILYGVIYHLIHTPLKALMSQTGGV